MATPRKTAPYVTTREKLDADQLAAIEAMKRINADAAARAQASNGSSPLSPSVSGPVTSNERSTRRPYNRWDVWHRDADTIEAPDNVRRSSVDGLTEAERAADYVTREAGIAAAERPDPRIVRSRASDLALEEAETRKRRNV